MTGWHLNCISLHYISSDPIGMEAGAPGLFPPSAPDVSSLFSTQRPKWFFQNSNKRKSNCPPPRKPCRSQVLLLLSSKWFNCFLFHLKYNPKSFLDQRPFLIWPRTLSNLISSHSFPCYLYSQTVLLTNPWTSQASTLLWASAWNSLLGYHYGWLPSFPQISVQRSAAYTFPCPPWSKTQSPLICVLCFILLSSYHHLGGTLKN